MRQATGYRLQAGDGPLFADDGPRFACPLLDILDDWGKFIREGVDQFSANTAAPEEPGRRKTCIVSPDLQISDLRGELSRLVLGSNGKGCLL